jgi:hypothetical protein
MYELVSENLTGLGGPMGTEHVSINFRKHFMLIDKARKFAEEDYGKRIKWKSYGKELRSPDLGYVLYRIKPIKIED